jgi:hypothetical protein
VSASDASRIILRVYHAPRTGEWIVRWTQGGVRRTECDHYCKTRDDAEWAARSMARDARMHGFDVQVLGLRSRE